MDQVDIFSPKVYESSVPRRQLSRYRPAEMTMAVVDETGQNVDADSIALEVAVSRPDEPGIVEHVNADSDEIIKDGTGLYRFVLGADKTQDPAILQANWNYTYQGRSIMFPSHYQILEFMPVYSSFSAEEKSVIERVSWRFADLFDNTVGGDPSFFEEFQTHWGYERIAQLAILALGKINTTRQPLTNYVLGSPGKPLGIEWHGLLEFATYVEVLKHFIRTYVEQPTIQGSTVTAVDRRDYMQRWQNVLQMEQEDLKAQMAMFKRKHMNLGRGSALVSGGIFGSSNYFRPGGYAAALRGGRFYPSSLAYNTGAF